MFGFCVSLDCQGILCSFSTAPQANTCSQAFPIYNQRVVYIQLLILFNLTVQDNYYLQIVKKYLKKTMLVLNVLRYGINVFLCHLCNPLGKITIYFQK